MSCATPDRHNTVPRLPFGAEQSPPRTPIASSAQRDAPSPKPPQEERAETYSVVVNNIAAQDLLFSLARDAKINIDIHPGISGTVTLHAINQTLPQLLKRIARQIDMRHELDGGTLTIVPDTPFLKTYKVDHVNMTRDTAGTVAVTTQVASGTTAASAGNLGVPVAGNLAGANNSITRVENKAQNHFWDTITRNIREILHETDKILPEGSSETVVEQSNAQTTSGTGTPPAHTTGRRGSPVPSLASSPNPAAMQNNGTTVVRRTTFREAASVIAHPESGVLSVRATALQHDKIQEFLEKVTRSSHRQVLIEAMVTEVRLSRDHQQGIDWSAVTLGRSGFSVTQKASGSVTTPPSSLLQLSYSNPQSRLGAIRAAINLLEGFGTVKVLSSPKLSVMNIRRFIDRRSLTFPIIGPLMHKLLLSRFAKLFSQLYAAGIPVLEAIRITQPAINNHALRDQLRQAETSISEGASIAAAFRDGNLFPSFVIRMLSAGERSGTLEKALENISSFYTRDVRERAGHLQQLIDPIMTLVVGGLLGWIMLAVLGPFYDAIAMVAP